METHPVSHPLVRPVIEAAHCQDIIAPRAAWLCRCCIDGSGDDYDLPRHTGPHATRCSQAMAFEPPPGQTKTPFRPGPNCDHAEQKQSVPPGCSLWSDPGFFLLWQFCSYVQHSKSLNKFDFWCCPTPKGAWKMWWVISFLWQFICVVTVGFDSNP